MEDFIKIFLTVCLIILAILIVFAFIRALTGKKLADKLVAVNMISTMVVMAIAILTVMLHESWLPDIAAIYALISFIAVVVFSRLYIGVRIKKRMKNESSESSVD